MEKKVEDTSTTTREFTLELLEQITDNFSEEHIIGRGGYGVVYKGVLENGEEIALKKLHHIPGLDDTQFRNEFNHLMRAQHPNITRLVGYCYNLGHQRIKYGGEYIFAHVEERVLCFEYLEGGSLDMHISDESCGLDWQTRFNIIRGICEGLNYLHNGSKDPIYHLDLKPANILLDKNMVPKIGDFGLSRLFPSTQTYITIKIIGTPGYMPPEYIDRCQITSKYDVFSLGVILVRIMAGYEGYSKCAHMSSQEFLDHVHENWEKRLQETMSSHISEQVKTCIEIALRCVEVDREKRPTIAEIVDELNKVDTAESSCIGQIANFQCKYALNRNLNPERRGRIIFSATYRPPVPFDIFCCPFPPSSTDCELHLTDGVSHNYNGRSIPPAALKTLLKRPMLANKGGVTEADVDAGHVCGLVFISEREDGLETLYIAMRFNADSKVEVFTLAGILGADVFSGMRLEDSGCIGGGYSVGSRTVDHCLLYVSTKEPVQVRHSPGTVVYKTYLTTGKTERLTPQGIYTLCTNQLIRSYIPINRLPSLLFLTRAGVFDLSPAVSPSGKMVAVASLQNQSWNSEIVESLKTDIYVMNVDSDESQGLGRKLLIKNGGWPSWGSDNIIFFHRFTNITLLSSMTGTFWAVFRYDISTEETIQVTPEELDAVTPAAISETKVAVATFRQRSRFSDVRVGTPYRHIEIFDTNALGLPPVQITRNTRSKGDHYNPFVLDGGDRIGYHRCRSDDLVQHEDNVPQNIHRLQSPMKDVGLFRVSGMFPTISKDGSKLAFVDNEFKSVFIADSQGLRIIYEERGGNCIFSPVWNQNPDKDILYVCIGTSLKSQELEIYAIRDASGPATKQKVVRLTVDGFNNAYPSSNPDGDKFVFCSTRGGLAPQKNLYIMLDSEFRERWETRLTKGKWTDTQCQWSPNGDWIVFSSTRDKLAFTNQLEMKYFSVYLVKATDPVVLIRVMNSGGDLGGRMNHPVFSPDGRSIAVTVDLAAVCVDLVSLPNFKHGLRQYGVILVTDIPPDNSEWWKYKYVKGSSSEKYKKPKVFHFRQMTHSRYECREALWTRALPATDQNALWNMLPEMAHLYALGVPTRSATP
uniref:Uncharacterized protein n=2 Tax=Avena sativa TaxID=4498 RepID=A0ACD5VAF5_AVESA